MALVEPVARAIDQIRKAFPESQISAREDGQGGAYLIVEPVDLGAPYEPRESWVGFRVTFQYPYADVYPHYIRGDLRRADGRPVVGDGVQAGQVFEGRPAHQVSRRSNRLNPQTDTALLKLEKVLGWLRSRL
jgi:hypothetical protein